MSEIESYPTAQAIGEFGVISRIANRLAERLPAAAETLVGPGDDAAVLALSGDVVATIDQFLEGRHFRREWSSAADVGAKAAARSLADIAAMGARPTALLVGLAMPADLPLDWVDGLVDGLAAECAKAGATVVGGDICASEAIALSVTGLGSLDGSPPTLRSGAEPGDIVVMTGRLGWSAAGLAAMLADQGDVPVLAAVVAAYRRPIVDYAAGAVLGRCGATSLIDVSDGLVADLGHIAVASGVDVDLSRRLLSIPAELHAAGSQLRLDPFEWVLSGGEDHAFVATLPPLALDYALSSGLELTAIGTVSESSMSEGVVTIDGERFGSPGGWRHF